MTDENGWGIEYAQGGKELIQFIVEVWHSGVTSCLYTKCLVLPDSLIFQRK